APVAAIRPPPASRPIQPSPEMKLPVQPPPAAGPPAQPPPVSPATSRTIPPPPRVETEPTRDGSMARITFVPPSAPVENKPEKPLPIGRGGPRFPALPPPRGPPLSPRRTTGRCADANPIPNAAV